MIREHFAKMGTEDWLEFREYREKVFAYLHTLTTSAPVPVNAEPLNLAMFFMVAKEFIDCNPDKQLEFNNDYTEIKPKQ